MPDPLGLLKRAGKLDADTVANDGVAVRAFGGGETTGPSLVNRGKKGTKRTLMADRHGGCWRSAPARTNSQDQSPTLSRLMRQDQAGLGGPRT